MDDSHASEDAVWADDICENKKDNEKGEDQVHTYYIVRSMLPAESPDPRCHLQTDLAAGSHNNEMYTNLTGIPVKPDPLASRNALAQMRSIAKEMLRFR